jgi:hypothetical protein
MPEGSSFIQVSNDISMLQHFAKFVQVNKMSKALLNFAIWSKEKAAIFWGKCSHIREVKCSSICKGISWR